jgi:hypothetical protein
MSEETPKIKAPVVFMKGGTTSSRFDAEVQRQKADQLARQSEQDEEIRLSKSETMTNTGGHSLASRKTMDLGSANTHPVAILQVLLDHGSRERYIQADIVIASDPVTGEIIRTLNLVCPSCVSRGLPQSQSQIKIDSRNRKWDLDERCKGDVWVDPDTRQPYVIAGKVECAEMCRCPQVGCSFSFKISPKSDHPAVSRVLKC